MFLSCQEGGHKGMGNSAIVTMALVLICLTSSFIRFPIFFPMGRPLCVSTGSPIEVRFWRCSGATKVSCLCCALQNLSYAYTLGLPFFFFFFGSLVASLSLVSQFFFSCRFGVSGAWLLHAFTYPQQQRKVLLGWPVGILVTVLSEV